MRPLVSVCCITYNHEKYIADAIDSFLMQKTDFPIEIIIHDDASNDRAPDIIREYELKYPEIIKPIYQTVNQHSQGIEVLDIIWGKAVGKYIAMCEGDDFWTDPLKLQKQTDFLEGKDEYSMCFHGVKIVDVRKCPLGRYLGPYKKGDGRYSIKDVVKGGFVHVSSILFRKEYIKNIPQWFYNAVHGDFPLMLLLSANGYIYYIDEIMSAYRINVENSKMTKFRENYSKENEIIYNKKRMDILDEADKYYNYKFHEELNEVKLVSEVKILMLKNNFSELKKPKYRNYLNRNGWIGKLKIIVINKYPKLTRFLLKIKGFINLNIIPLLPYTGDNNDQ